MSNIDTAVEQGLLLCPVCREPLGAGGGGLRCGKCSLEFLTDNGIPLLFWPHHQPGGTPDDVTRLVKEFYEETPFPNYEDLDSRETLEHRARRAVFADVLDTQVPAGALILEAGCGTGQLSNFMALRPGRRVFGTDICLNSLRLGHQFAGRNQITGVAFVQMNLFRPVFSPATFDLVISNGVLHHTSDPFGGFRAIAELVRPGGLIVVGLYNRFGRIMTNVRRKLFQVGGRKLDFLDPRLRATNIGETKRHTWFMDQYRHPHESQHSIGEVMGWFQECGIEFVNSIPKLQPSATMSDIDDVLNPHSRGKMSTRMLVQAQMALADREGGFFVMIGRRPG